MGVLLEIGAGGVDGPRSETLVRTLVSQTATIAYELSLSHRIHRRKFTSCARNPDRRAFMPRTQLAQDLQHELLLGYA